MLRVENLAVETDQAVPILENVNIRIKKNKITSLIGESGAGKTIFAKTLTALLPAHIAMTKGTIFYEDQPVTYDRLKKMRGSHIFYTPQNAPGSSLKGVRRPGAGPYGAAGLLLTHSGCRL